MKNKISLDLFISKIKTVNNPIEFNLACDNFFNYNYTQIEHSLLSIEGPEHLYLRESLKEEALNTSWYDYLQLIKLACSSNKKILDVGSGYSKGTLLSLCLGYDNITSVEIVSERISWAQNKALELGLPTKNFIIGDCLKVDFNLFDIFYLYQPVGPLLTNLLKKISSFENKIVWAIESHGDLINKLDFDNRLINKNIELIFTAKRHSMNLYSYNFVDSHPCSYTKFEELLYNGRYLIISDSNSVYGNFSWMSRTDEAFIDYIDKTPFLNINGARINLIINLDRLVFKDCEDDFQQRYLHQKAISYANKEQRILKVIIHPRNALELSSSGLVPESILLSTRPSS